MYIRMTFRAVDVYELLEPLLKDYRKLRTRHMGKAEPFWLSSPTETRPGGYSLTFIDEYASELLTEDRVCDIILPRLQKRQILEENSQIGPRKSRLLAAMDDGSEDGSTKNRSSRSPDRSLSRSPSGTRSVSRGSRSPSDAGSRYVSRSPSRSLSRSPSPDKSESGMDIDGGS
jgi:pre-mRNA-splicing factor 38A